MKIFDRYGVKAPDDVVAAQVAEKLDVAFQLHESEHSGLYYLARVGDSGDYRLIQNFQNGEWEEEDHQEFPWLLEVNDVPDADAVLALLAKSPDISLLLRSEVEARKWIRCYTYDDGRFQLVREKQLRI